MDKFIEDEIAAIKAASERELRQMNLLHNKKMEAKLATKKKLEMLAEQAKNSELLYTQQQSEQYINNIRQMAEENVEDLKKRMEDTASRMQESRERILAEETQDVDNEEDDEEWVDCEDIDYQGVNYSACEGSATANFIIDEDIRILRIPDKIKDEDGNE